MDEQYLGQRVNPSNEIEGTDWEKNLPLEKSYTLAEDIPVYGTPVLETPVLETPVMETPVVETPVVETPVVETPVTESAMLGTRVLEKFASVGSPVEARIFQEDSLIPAVRDDTHVATKDAEAIALISREESDQLRLRWNEIQGKFVDEPRAAVQQADVLVTEVIEQITQMFSTEHSLLENQWKNGEDVSTEDLRNSLKRYRSFFNRLVV